MPNELQGYVLRRMNIDDVPQVAMLEEMIFTDPWSENVYRQTLSIDGVIYIVIEHQNRIIGVCGIRNIVGDGEITNVMIHPDYRGQGLSKLMLLKLLEEGERIGVENVTLEVRASNKTAIRLYEQLGFKLEGVRPMFYEHPKEDALIYWKYKE